MKTCPRCGAMVDDSAAFCPRCGERLPSSYASVRPASSAPVVSASRTPLATVAMVLGIVGISISVIGYVIFGFLEFFSLGLGVMATVMGGVAMRTHSGKAKAGLALGIVTTVLSFIGIILYLINLISL